MKEGPLVTIVVPIYNVEKYLNKCLESLVKQSYKNIQILLINDGSEDNSLDIAKRKAENDHRIEIITQENQGLSAARNKGIQSAKGEYICFVDSDDFVDSNYVKLLLESSLKNDADISACDFYYIDENENLWAKKEKEEYIFSNIEAIKDIFTGKQHTEVIVCNKLYKLNLFKKHNIYFPVGKLHEDNFTTYKLYYYANKITLITNKLYFYLQRTNSITTKKFNTKRMDTLEVINEAMAFFENENVDLKEEIQCYEIIMKIGLLNNMIRDNFYGKEQIKLITEIKKKKKTYLKNKYVNIAIKGSLFLLFGKGKLYKFVYTIFNKIKS